MYVRDLTVIEDVLDYYYSYQPQPIQLIPSIITLCDKFYVQ